MFRIENITQEDNGVAHRDEKKIIHLAIQGSIEGDKKISLGQLETAVTSLKSSTKRILLLDLKDLDYIDRAGIAEIFNIAKDLSLKEHSVSLINVPAHISEAFEVAGFLPGISNAPIIEDAEAADQYLRGVELEKKEHSGDKKHFKTIILKS